jgi:diguanylate cyclase (GGDEF)-like protein
MKNLNLRSLILLLTVCATLLTSANFFYASYQTQRELLINQTFEANRNYAMKLAEMGSDFIKLGHMQIGFSASKVPGFFGNTQQMNAETDRLQQQTNSFNSTFIVDATGRLLSNSPLQPHMIGNLLNTPGTQQALQERRPLITAPYMSARNKLVVTLSHPLFDAEGQYLGYVGGSIFLKEDNIFKALFDEHFYRDGSYLFVVDGSGQLLYHMDPQRVGELIVDNPAIEAVLAGQAGSLQMKNSQGIEMLAGYAPIPSAHWGVIAQRPLDVTLQQLRDHELRLLRNAIPLMLLVMLAVWWLSRIISRPLWQLARSAREDDGQRAADGVFRVNAWYFEATELRKSMLQGLISINRKVSQLNLASITDPLTGLLNRRGNQVAIDEWLGQGRVFSVISLDIDHFKRVNDTYGHDVGDVTIQFLADQMRQFSRSGDILCRTGGEEFAMLLPDASLEQAQRVAERLCQHMAQTQSPTGQPITLSLGVAYHSGHTQDSKQVLKAADQALYQAKQQGRNRVICAD